MAFWDSSAAMALCIQEPSTAWVRRTLRSEPRMAVWWGTPIELACAFARLQRDGTVDAKGHASARSRLGALRRSWLEVLPGDRLRALAESLPRTHPLRAGDAVQLAAALIWCKERPRRRPFVCFDGRLGGAAAGAGFDVLRDPSL